MDRLNRLVGSLLSLAKAEPSANRSGSFVPVDLNSIASNICKTTLRPKASANNIELIFLAETEPTLIQGNSVSLQDLISNLIENAIPYTQTGELVMIQLTSKDKGSSKCRRQCPGIPNEERERVFERFIECLAQKSMAMVWDSQLSKKLQSGMTQDYR